MTLSLLTFRQAFRMYMKGWIMMAKPSKCALVVSSDLSDDLVYGITKALWNKNTRKLLDNGHAKGKQITAETALDGVSALGVPLHPGSEKFYKEAGLLK